MKETFRLVCLFYFFAFANIFSVTSGILDIFRAILSDQKVNYNDTLKSTVEVDFSKPPHVIIK